MFSRVMNHASSSGNPIEESGFGSCLKDGTCLTALCQVQSVIVFQELDLPPYFK